MADTILHQSSFDELVDALADRIVEKIAMPAKVERVDPDQIMTEKELCAYLRITQPTAVKWRQKGKLPFFQIGSAVRYSLNEVKIALKQ